MKTQALALLKQVEDLYIDQIYQTPFLNIFLEEKKISIETAEHFHLGFASDNNAVFALVKDDSVKMTLALELGLIVNTANGYKDFFQNRLMFPLWDEEGHCIGFDSRSVHEGTVPKYKNSKHSQIFSRCDVLYGFHLAKKASRYGGEVSVLEGIMEVWEFYERGYYNAVGNLGYTISPENIAKLAALSVDGIKPTLHYLSGIDNPDVSSISGLEKRFTLSFKLGGFDYIYQLYPNNLNEADAEKVMKFFMDKDIKVIKKPNNRLFDDDRSITDSYKLPVKWAVDDELTIWVDFDVDTIHDPIEREAHNNLLFSGLLKDVLVDHAKSRNPYMIQDNKVYMPTHDRKLWTRYSLKGVEEGVSECKIKKIYTFTQIS
jgi:hypothetical protein